MLQFCNVYLNLLLLKRSPLNRSPLNRSPLNKEAVCHPFNHPQVPQRPQSESEQTPVELPPDVSLQRPLEESLKNITLPIHPSSSSSSEEEEEGEEDSVDHNDSAVSEVSPVTVAVEESRSRPSTVVTASTTFENPQHVAAGVVSPSVYSLHGIYILICIFHHYDFFCMKSDLTFEEQHGHVHVSTYKINVITIHLAYE